MGDNLAGATTRASAEGSAGNGPTRSSLAAALEAAEVDLFFALLTDFFDAVVTEETGSVTAKPFAWAASAKKKNELGPLIIRSAKAIVSGSANGLLARLLGYLAAGTGGLHDEERAEIEARVDGMRAALARLPASRAAAKAAALASAEAAEGAAAVAAAGEGAAAAAGAGAGAPALDGVEGAGLAGFDDGVALDPFFIPDDGYDGGNHGSYEEPASAAGYSGDASGDGAGEGAAAAVGALGADAAAAVEGASAADSAGDAAEVSLSNSMPPLEDAAAGDLPLESLGNHDWPLRASPISLAASLDGRGGDDAVDEAVLTQLSLGETVEPGYDGPDDEGVDEPDGAAVDDSLSRLLRSEGGHAADGAGGAGGAGEADEADGADPPSRTLLPRPPASVRRQPPQLRARIEKAGQLLDTSAASSASSAADSDVSLASTVNVALFAPRFMHSAASEALRSAAAASAALPASALPATFASAAATSAGSTGPVAPPHGAPSSAIDRIPASFPLSSASAAAAPAAESPPPRLQTPLEARSEQLHRSGPAALATALPMPSASIPPLLAPPPSATRALEASAATLAADSAAASPSPGHAAPTSPARLLSPSPAAGGAGREGGVDGAGGSEARDRGGSDVEGGSGGELDDLDAIEAAAMEEADGAGEAEGDAALGPYPFALASAGPYAAMIKKVAGAFDAVVPVAMEQHKAASERAAATVSSVAAQTREEVCQLTLAHQVALEAMGGVDAALAPLRAEMVPLPAGLAPKLGETWLGRSDIGGALAALPGQRIMGCEPPLPRAGDGAAAGAPDAGWDQFDTAKVQRVEGVVGQLRGCGIETPGSQIWCFYALFAFYMLASRSADTGVPLRIHYDAHGRGSSRALLFACGMAPTTRLILALHGAVARARGAGVANDPEQWLAINAELVSCSECAEVAAVADEVAAAIAADGPRVPHQAANISWGNALGLLAVMARASFAPLRPTPTSAQQMLNVEASVVGRVAAALMVLAGNEICVTCHYAAAADAAMLAQRAKLVADVIAADALEAAAATPAALEELRRARRVPHMPRMTDAVVGNSLYSLALCSVTFWADGDKRSWHYGYGGHMCDNEHTVFAVAAVLMDIQGGAKGDCLSHAFEDTDGTAVVGLGGLHALIARTVGWDAAFHQLSVDRDAVIELAPLDADMFNENAGGTRPTGKLAFLESRTGGRRYPVARLHPGVLPGDWLTAQYIVGVGAAGFVGRGRFVGLTPNQRVAIIRALGLLASRATVIRDHRLACRVAACRALADQSSTVGAAAAAAGPGAGDAGGE